MIRRLATVAVLAGSAVMVLQAQNTVTFVMTNGEKAVGDFADRTDPNPVMPYGELNLYAGPEKNERSFAQETVAVIAYADGDPSNEELAALPAEGQLLVLRNGTRHPGRIAGLRDGVLRWTGSSGNVEQYPVSQIGRVYLDVNAARRVYNYTPGVGGGAVKPPAGAVAVGDGIAVHANRPWTDTGLVVRSGEAMRFAASGEIKFGMGDTQRANADGNAEVRNTSFPVSSAPVGALIGRIGTGEPFLIGSRTEPITMGRTGRLFLGINDDGFGDNTGQFVVKVTRGR